MANHEEKLSYRVEQLTGYARELYSRLRLLSERLGTARDYVTHFAAGNSTYGNSNIPENGGYEMDCDYERNRRRSNIIPEFA